MPAIDEDIQALLDADRIDDAVVEYVRKHDHVSMVEIERILARKFEVRGDRGIVNDEFNMVLWSSVSRQFTDTVIRLTTEGRLHYHTSSALVYMIDGRMPGYPVVKQARKYKEPHWLPVVLRVVPSTAPTVPGL